MRLDFCVLCGEKDTTALEHHHYVPKVQGGTDDENNIFTVCGACHGRIHDIPRPLRLGELIKEGQAKAQERTSAEYRQIADQRAQQAKKAAALARQTEQAENKARAEALRQARREAHLRLVSSSEQPKEPKPVKSTSRPALALVSQQDKAIAALPLDYSLLPADPSQPENAIRAEIIGSDRCDAEGRTILDDAPVLAMCRELLRAGYERTRPLWAYRRGMVALKVRSIREGARLSVGPSKCSFALHSGAVAIQAAA